MLVSTPRRWPSICAVLALLLAACTAQQLPPVDPYAGATPRPDATPLTVAARPYLARVSAAPAKARYFDLVQKQLGLNANELALLERQGFVVSDRLAFEKFTTAYAYIYWKDLPVLVTTDSILHAIHQTYDDLLKNLETSMLAPWLDELLAQTRRQLEIDRGAAQDPRLLALYADLETYLAVPRALLQASPRTPVPPAAEPYLALAEAAGSVEKVRLFGGERDIDFTLFKPRGHYTESEALQRYFRAMSWLAQIDFRMVEYNPHGRPYLNLDHVAAAVLLRQTIDRAGQRPSWEQFDALFGAFVGRSDNTTLPDLDRFMADAGLKTPGDVLGYTDPARLLELLTTRDYGHQRITGQLIWSAPGNGAPVPRPVSTLR